MLRSWAVSLKHRYPSLDALRQNLQMTSTVLLGEGRRASRSWSEFGEDDWLSRELGGLLNDGYYIDIGANHPSHHSNTYRLYNLGMRGICVEPNEVLASLHRRFRPHDIFLNAAIGPENTIMKFYEMRCNEHSTFSEDDMNSRVTAGGELIRISLKPVFRLQTLIETCVPPGRTKFELLSIDTEGWDEVVLRSHHFETHRPRLILIESNNEEAAASIGGLLGELRYERLDRFGVNTLYRDVQSN